MEQHTNSFSKGLNTDLSKTLYQNTQYLRADNFRLVTERGSSEFSLETIKGNVLNKVIPKTSSVVKLRIDPISMAWVGGEIVELSRPGLNALVFADTWTIGNLPQYSVEEIHNLFRDFINNSATFAAEGFRAATKGDYVIIWNTDTNGEDIVVGGSLIFNFPANVFVDTIVSSLDALKIIGRGYIRDTVVLFTTSSTTDAADPESLNSDGQIWTLDYQPTNPTQSTLTLRYNNILNFTTAHPIPSTDGSVGRAENNFIQRIYWTDNYNRPRQLNTVDVDAMAIVPASLELKSPASFTEVILTNILQSGGVLTGMHNFAYRLLKNNGEASVYSPVSNNIHVVAFNEETSPYPDYKQTPIGQIVAKSLQCRINDLDSSFDVIEVVNIYRNSIDSIPEITRFLSEPIPNNGTFEFTYTGFEDDVIDITIPEFEFDSVRFKTVKSFADKSNRLFPSNVVIDKFSVDFDARSYRWQSVFGADYDPGLTTVEDSAGNTSQVGSGNTWNLSENHDAITPDQAPEFVNNFLYQSDGVTIGGSGLNISYTFTTTEDGKNDMHLDSANSQGDPEQGYVRVGTTQFTYDIAHEETYRNGVAFRNFHSPYIAGLLRGFQRDEVYRFGIIFYSLDGVPSDVKWIADIRMPHVYMWNLTTGGLGPPDFFAERTRQFPIYTQSNNNCFGYNLGVKFDVNISSVADKISGWSIVRVKREEKDRSVLGQGMFHAAYSHFNDAAHTAFLDVRLMPHFTFDAFNYPLTSFIEPSEGFATINSPEFLFGASPSFAQGDRIDVVDILHPKWSWDIYIDSTLTPIPSTVMDSDLTVFWNTATSITNQTVANPAALGSVNNLEDFIRGVDAWHSDPNPIVHPSTNVVNVGPNHGVGNPGQISMGGRTTLLRASGGNFTMVSNALWSQDGLNVIEQNKYLVNYKRTPVLQYGGNTFSQRSNNEYIYCGHFQPTDINSTTFTDVIIFGGDTYVSMFDNIKRFKNWNGHPIYGIQNGSAEDEGCISSYAFPVETTLNVDLRGTTPDTINVMNKEYIPNTGATSADTNESFLLDSLWSIENTIKTFFPKPANAQDVEVFDHRTYVSPPKIDGELQDSWTIFPVNDYLDVEGRYGQINSTCVLNDKFYFLQDRAIGLHSVNERVLTQDLTGATLQLGTGQVLDRFDYLSTEIGTKHQWSVLPDTSGLYFYCSTLNRIYKFSGEGLENISATKGVQSYINNNYSTLIDSDNPIIGQGIIAGKNPLYNEILFTFINPGETGPRLAETLCYNSKINHFSNFYGFAPKLYINFNQNMFTCQGNQPISADRIWWHDVGLYNSFYGTILPSTVKLLINPHPLDTKIFDNFSYHAEVTNSNGQDSPIDTFNTLQSTTNYQDTGVITLTNNINVKRKERTWQLGTGRNNTVEQERLRDKFLIANWAYNNTGNRKMIIHYFNTFYRKSYR